VLIGPDRATPSPDFDLPHNLVVNGPDPLVCGVIDGELVTCLG
jgi:hypothetical protein